MPVYLYNPFEDDGFEPKTKTNMPYDYAREIDEARERSLLDEFIADNERKSIPSFFSCTDGFCGALDCPRCHPENTDHDSPVEPD